VGESIGELKMSLRAAVGWRRGNLQIPRRLLRRAIALLAMTYNFLLLDHLLPIYQTPLPGVDSHLCPVCEMELAQDVADMTLHSVFTDH